MKSLRLWLAVGLAMAFAFQASAQIQVDGQLYSDLYAFEDASESQRVDFYPGVMLRLRPEGYRNLQFKGNFRLARRGDPADWSERVYNGYADWRADGGVVQARLGRQFLYQGVINGSVDGMSLALRPTDGVDLKVVGGVSAPYDRSLDIKSWDEGGLLGAYVSARVAPEAKVEASYVQQRRAEQVAWEQVGGALNGVLAGAVYYQAQLDYNLKASTVQGMRYRATYAPDGPWQVFAEYNAQRPRIFEDSYFNIFELEGFQQLRGGLSRTLGPYQVGVEGFHTIYEEEETTDEVMVRLGSSWGAIGVVYQTGYGGDNFGLYADVRYPVGDDLTLRLHSSHYSYQRRSIAISEEATAVSGGIEYRPIRDLRLLAEVQQSLNTYYSNDVRGLLRLTYLFRSR